MSAEGTLVRLVHIPLGALRRRAYRKGKRPRPGTLLYSPSLDMLYAWKDASRRFAEGVRSGRLPRS